MRTHVLLPLVIVALAGCKNSYEKQLEREQVIIQPALDHDPTDDIRLAQWWSNDAQLLRLDDNAGYALYDGTNRFARPAERGRWSRTSYAVLWLEPYNTLTVDRRRVSITKADGRLALTVPGKAPMYALSDGPPATLEDRMIGEWSGPMGTLHLTGELRFSLSPQVDDAGSLAHPQLRAFPRGAWQIANDQLVLRSDIPGIDPLTMSLTVEDSKVQINAPGGTMTKVEPVAAGNVSQ
jgi:hypothetical protein